MEKVIDLSDLFLEIGGVQITGFGEDAITIPSPENLTTSKKGLDSVAWLRQNALSMEIPVTVNLLANAGSVKVMKGFEKTNVIVPFRFEWEELGIYVEALDAIVREVGELKINTEMPELSFEVKLKNFVEIKGI